MSDIAKILGQRIRNYRTSKGLSQEKLAELSGCHPTYIGQLERGEKNATVESVECTVFFFFGGIREQKMGESDTGCVRFPICFVWDGSADVTSHGVPQRHPLSVLCRCGAL